MSDIKLGNLITTPAYSDAIHIAVTPVTSVETVKPGQHLALVDGTTDRVQSSNHAIGIVDPFLMAPVPPGQPFWLLLYPQTITSLRHEWTHPAFPIKELIGSDDAKIALTALATRCGCVSLNELMSRLDSYAEGWSGSDDEIQSGLNRLSDENAVRDMWTSYEKVRGVKVDDKIKNETYFRCAC